MTVITRTRSVLGALLSVFALAACSPSDKGTADRNGGGVLYADAAAAQQQPPGKAQQQPPGRGAAVDSAGRGLKAAPELAERVWLNTTSKIYHCAGTASYGTTKDGKYMSEKAAQVAGNRPARDSICGPIKVWVNTESSIYHCPGSANYGKTATGKYMTEPEARKAKIQPSRGQTCEP